MRLGRLFCVIVVLWFAVAGYGQSDYPDEPPLHEAAEARSL
jgi:hypothetical protein